MFNEFRKFKALAYKESGSHITTLRSDNVGKLYSKGFNSFRAKHGIKRIYNTLHSTIMALSNFRQYFDIEVDARFSMGAILNSGGILACYHSKQISSAILDHPPHNCMNPYKHFLIRKEKITHSDHQPLQYL